jgi:hypothetical protein
MLDSTSTQALAKELAPPFRRREAWAEANSTSTSPSLTADGLDRMYQELPATSPFVPPG